MKKPEKRVVFLRGKKVHLSTIVKGDIPLFLKWFNDEKVNRYLKLFFPLTEAGEAEWVENMHKHQNENIILGIVEAKSGRLIGTMGLHRISWKDRRAVSAAVIGEKKFWGKGYGSEAKMLFLNYAFNTLNLRKVCSAVLGFNKRSQAYNKKCGYRVEGVLRRHIYKEGKYADEVLMAVFKEDWLPLWEKFRKVGRV